MSSQTITIEAGPHDRRNCPLEFRLPEPIAVGAWLLVGDDGTAFDLQTGADGLARCVLPALTRGRSQTFRVAADAGPAQAVSVIDDGSAVEISLRGDLLTRYVYAGVPSRPYFFPVYAPDRIAVTRAYPMIPDAPGETHDHPHHRSLWIAHGEVNDADNWSEAPDHARTVHGAFGSLVTGAVAGSFQSTSMWERSDGSPLLTQHLRVTAWATDGDLRILDFEIGLEASHGEVRFGDTKEGGILSVRVATELDVSQTGRITNVYGGIDEAENWGKAAHWCDYSGTVNGAPAGIAVLDHPHSFRYPTHWHVRNYGLMTANPFAYAAYTDGVKEGSHTLPAGATLPFRYRVILHKGGCEEAQINGRYLDFVAPPRVTVTK